MLQPATSSMKRVTYTQLLSYDFRIRMTAYAYEVYHANPIKQWITNCVDETINARERSFAQPTLEMIQCKPKSHKQTNKNMSAALCCATNIHGRFILSLAAFDNCQLVNVLQSTISKRRLLFLNMHFSCNSTFQVSGGS